ncbi:MAG: nuclear transport factor 2 family protein [Acidipila sp.]|nr:nuclear transport factor 2 family protein [Acidipila sp.]
MTKLAVVSVVGALAFCILSSKQLQKNPATAEGNSSASREAISEMTNNERAVWEAAKQKDMVRFASLVGDDARMIFTSGIVTRDEYIRSIADRNITNYSLKNFQVFTPSADTAIVVYDATIAGIFKGNAVSSYTVREASVWVKRSGKWIAVLNQETPMF